MFKPMLAVNAKTSKIKFPVMGSLKLEGVRGIFTPVGLKTRPMKNFGNPLLSAKFAEISKLCNEKDIVIEGEFYVHGMTFNDISSICRRSHHPDVDKIEFHIFDMYSMKNPDIGFRDRIALAQGILSTVCTKDVYFIEQHMQHTIEDVMDRYSDAIYLGYEGWVMKAPNARYKLGRSTISEGYFIRLKEQNSWDGKVIEIVEMMENLVESEENELGYMSKRQDKDMKEGKGMAAVAVCECADFPGKEIRVTLSRGLTDADRAEIWINRSDYIGRHLRWVGIPVKGMLPRSPRFDVWRTDLD